MLPTITPLILDSTHPALFAEICRDKITKEPSAVIRMIWDQIRDNRGLCVEMFGEKLVTIIETL